MDFACANHPDKADKYYCSKYERYLCDDCIACQDPKLYCKFRKMCFVWEAVKHGTPEMQEAAFVAEKAKEIFEAAGSAKITFFPANKIIEVEKGTTVLEAAHKGDIYINARCGGKGVCGSCKVKLDSGKLEYEDSPLFDQCDRDRGFVLACASRIYSDVSVVVPDENKARALKIVKDGYDIKEKILDGRAITPLVSVIPLELTPPSLADASSDLERVRYALSRAAYGNDYIFISLPKLRELTAALRTNNWKINVALLHYGSNHEIIQTRPYNPHFVQYGLAVDMGTTSVVAYLVDLTNGEVIGSTSSQNRQVVCGEDVISRIICAQGKEGLDRFHDYAIGTINALADELISVTKINRDDILSFSVAGNTVMIQSVLKLDPANIRTEPYVPVAVEFPILHARNIDLNINPWAGVYVVPGNAAYVGGDITAGILVSGLHKRKKTTLFIDVGTNGEMVLGNKDWMMTASCSAGPAFEGGGIRHGMRALPGAIDSVSIDPKTFDVTVSVIDNEKPAGLCGSGMISLIASLYMAGIIDSSGKFSDINADSRLRTGHFGKEFVIAWQKDSQLEEDVIITEADIATLMQSKAAVYGGIITLLKSAGIDLNAIDRIQLAGGFGRYIDFEQAIILGMMPDVDLTRFEYLGNSSMAGSYLALVSKEARTELHKISKAMTYIDFSSSNLFYDEYIQALFLPHTDIRSFPTVAKKMKK